MSEDVTAILVSRAKEAAFVRVVGPGSFHNSHPLRSWALDMIRSWCHEFSVDLAQCPRMDSTFLGVLAGIGLRLQERGGEPQLHLVNADARNAETVHTLGLDPLLRIDAPASDDRSSPADSEFQVLPGLRPGADRLDTDRAAAMMLEAHEDLCRIDRRNETRFADVTHLLRERVVRNDPTSRRKS